MLAPPSGLRQPLCFVCWCFHPAAPWPSKRRGTRLPSYTGCCFRLSSAFWHHSSPVVQSQPCPSMLGHAAPLLFWSSSTASLCYLWKPSLCWKPWSWLFAKNGICCPIPGHFTTWKDACALGAPEPFHCTLSAHLPVGRCHPLSEPLSASLPSAA